MATARSRLLLAAALGVGAYCGLLRPRFNALGATPEEAEASYPGDDLIPDADGGSIMATTVAVRPSELWPWLVQMGCDRAGFYSWDRLDNGGRPSAKRIHPEWQDLKVGDRVACVPDGSVWFDVAVLDPERALVLRSSLSLPKGRWFNPAGRPPRFFNDSTWGFSLRPTKDNGTRLITYGKGRGEPRWVITLANRLFLEPAHWVMQTKQLAELRRRAEGSL